MVVHSVLQKVAKLYDNTLTQAFVLIWTPHAHTSASLLSFAAARSCSQRPTPLHVSLQSFMAPTKKQPVPLIFSIAGATRREQRPRPLRPSPVQWRRIWPHPVILRAQRRATVSRGALMHLNRRGWGGRGGMRLRPHPPRGVGRKGRPTPP